MLNVIYDLIYVITQKVEEFRVLTSSKIHRQITFNEKECYV